MRHLTTGHAILRQAQKESSRRVARYFIWAIIKYFSRCRQAGAASRHCFKRFSRDRCAEAANIYATPASTHHGRAASACFRASASHHAAWCIWYFARMHFHCFISSQATFHISRLLPYGGHAGFGNRPARQEYWFSIGFSLQKFSVSLGMMTTRQICRYKNNDTPLGDMPPSPVKPKGFNISRWCQPQWSRRRQHAQAALKSASSPLASIFRHACHRATKPGHASITERAWRGLRFLESIGWMLMVD